MLTHADEIPVSVTAAVLAGDPPTPAWSRYDGLALVEHMIRRLRPQVERVIVRTAIEIPADGGCESIPHSLRPRDALAELIALLQAVSSDCLLLLPGGLPLLPEDLVPRLLKSLGTDGYCAWADDGLHVRPAAVLFRRQCLALLEADYRSGGRGYHRWLSVCRPRRVDFSDCCENFVHFPARAGC